MKLTALPWPKQSRFSRPSRTVNTSQQRPPGCPTIFYDKCRIACEVFTAYLLHFLAHNCLLRFYLLACFRNYLVSPCIAHSFHIVIIKPVQKEVRHCDTCKHINQSNIKVIELVLIDQLPINQCYLVQVPLVQYIYWKLQCTESHFSYTYPNYVHHGENQLHQYFWGCL